LFDNENGIHITKYATNLILILKTFILINLDKSNPNSKITLKTS